MYQSIKSLKYGLTIWILLSSILSFSQPCFNALDTVGCADFEVKMISCSSESLIRYKYGDGSHSTIFGDTNTSHTFTQPGLYSIVQYAGFTSVDSLVKSNYITVLDDPEPVISVSYCENFIVNFDVPLNGYDEYILSYDNGEENDTISEGNSFAKSFGSTAPVNITVTGRYFEASCSNTSTLRVYPFEKLELASIVAATLSPSSWDIGIYGDARFINEITYGPNLQLFRDTLNIDTNTFLETIAYDSIEDRNWSFKIISSDACGITLESDTVSSTLLNGRSENERNVLNWMSYTANGLLNYHLIRNTTDTLYSGLDTAFIDSNVNCGSNYTYEVYVEVSHKNPNMISPLLSSNLITLTAFSTNTPPALLWSLVTSDSANNTLIKWSYPTESEGSTMLIETLSGQNLTSQNSPEIVTFDPIFILSYTDLCGNISPVQDSLNPIIIESMQLGLYDFKISRSTYSSSSSSENTCEINIYDSNYVIIESYPFLSNDTIEVNGPFEESQTIYLSTSCELTNGQITHSNYIKINQLPQLRMPNAFSPNNDQLNDTFGPTPLFISNYTMSIYNVAGSLIYEGTEWTGPEVSKDGIYMFEIKGIDQLGNNIEKKGTVTLINPN